MNAKKLIIFVVAAGLMAGAAGALGWLKSNQRLGAPGVRTRPLEGEPEGSLRVEVALPAYVPGYYSTNRPMDDLVVNALPPDTSFGQRIYTADDDGFWIQLNVVLMGTDRTSIHKPQFCLVGAGFDIESEELTTIPIPNPIPYDLPVAKIKTFKEGTISGRPFQYSGVFVYWFVEENEMTGSHEERMASMARSMLTEGVLQRWAYITCFAVCQPGHEDATFERMKSFLADAVPMFQIPPRKEDTVLGMAP